jgi:proton-dependent oligopeptide transporter, POT family
MMNRLDAPIAPIKRGGVDVADVPLESEEHETLKKNVEVEEKGGHIDASSDDYSDASDEPEPTAEEKGHLRHVPEALPLTTWLIAVIELCERFTYYDISGIF